MLELRPLVSREIGALQSFCRARLEHSMFLLSNLRQAGFGYGPHPLAGQHFGAFDQTRRAQRQQVGVARPSANKRDGSCVFHDAQMGERPQARQREWIGGVLGKLWPVKRNFLKP